MGDRALIQLKVGNRVSPVLYLHSGGSGVKDLLLRTEGRMASHAGDLDYAFARLAQEAMRGDEYTSGVGIWNQESELVADDSHGDAGCFVVDVNDVAWVINAFGGYGLRRTGAA